MHGQVAVGRDGKYPGIAFVHYLYDEQTSTQTSTWMSIRPVLTKRTFEQQPISLPQALDRCRRTIVARKNQLCHATFSGFLR
jgi:hypothetical protein